MQDIGYHKPRTISKPKEHLSYSGARVLATNALLESYPQQTGPEIREDFSGNLCRCTRYNNTVDAIHRVINEASDG